MIVHQHNQQWYVDKLNNNEYFSFGMYGDGEWIGIFKTRVDGANAEDTLYTPKVCDGLIESLRYRADNWYFSTPDVLKNAQWTGIGEKIIDRHLQKYNVNDIEFIEKEIWDKDVKDCKLQPIIKALKKKNICIISNKALRKLTFLNYDHFIEIGYPNWFDDDYDRILKEVLDYGKEDTVYLVAAGLPATILCQDIHKNIKNCWAFDLGSIWDAFCGIGAQRGWRESLYSEPERYKQWMKDSLKGT